MNHHIVFDTEIIGLNKPVFLLCARIVETGESFAFWHHKKRGLPRFLKLLKREDLTWVSFNGIKFDAPLLAAWVNGHSVVTIKMLATRIIEDRLQPWQSHDAIGEHPLQFDHIDLIEVAPGVMTSLKTYAGRMGCVRMIDLPYHHDSDLTGAQCKVLEDYCRNDLAVTEALFQRLRKQLDLRITLSNQHGLELRSKSDAQVAEAILKKETQIGKAKAVQVNSVRYTAPDFIQSDNQMILDLIEDLGNEVFKINPLNSAPILPEWLKEPFYLHGGRYKVGLGGLHSQHDTKVSYVATDDFCISDFDVVSYYPTIILNCGLVPTMGGGKGAVFIEAYRDIYEQRLAAKNAGDKAVADSLKISLNGLFGKLGSKYSPFYSPDLLLMVTLTGQLNLLTLIDDLAKQSGIFVLSANTDGVMVGYHPSLRVKVLATVAANASETNFEYEEKRYDKVALKDVNNYIAVMNSGEVKAKGLYAEAGLQKNPTMSVCSKAVIQFLVDGTPPEMSIQYAEDFSDFTAIRAVRGGGEQAGVELGRVARWYMTTDKIPPIQYSSNGNKVPKTDGARACMFLPDSFPDDLDYQWYIDESYNILTSLGVAHERTA